MIGCFAERAIILLGKRGYLMNRLPGDLMLG